MNFLPISESRGHTFLSLRPNNDTLVTILGVGTGRWQEDEPEVWSRGSMVEVKHVDAYTDGACIGNPGPGGFGIVLLYGPHRRELSGGYCRTTNNRMELLAAVMALQALKEVCHVRLFSDSQYLVAMMRDDWPRRWEANGWRRSKKGAVANPDLWATLLRLCEKHRVDFIWVKGHAGKVENERCDSLAMQAALQPDLPADEGYEAALNSLK
jgi:ribonuclease HI